MGTDGVEGSVIVRRWGRGRLEIGFVFWGFLVSLLTSRFW